MPIEIKELYIHVEVNDPSSGQQPSAGGNDKSADQEAMVAECVEQVLHILQNKLER